MATAPVFSAIRDRGTVADALRHFQGERYILDGFVVMPNHVHALLQPLSAHSLRDILHSWKSFTANALNQLARTERRGLDGGSHDHIVRDWDELQPCGGISRRIRRRQTAEEEFVLEVSETLDFDDGQRERPAGSPSTSQAGCLSYKRAMPACCAARSDSAFPIGNCSFVRRAGRRNSRRPEFGRRSSDLPPRRYLRGGV